jgi:hypothetical protein
VRPILLFGPADPDGILIGISVIPISCRAQGQASGMGSNPCFALLLLPTELIPSFRFSPAHSSAQGPQFCGSEYRLCPCD